MQLRLDVRSVAGIVVIYCKGPIVFGQETAFLANHIAGLITPKGRMLLHLGEVTALDAAGIGALAVITKKARDCGVEIRLCSPSRRLAQLLRVARLNQALACYATEEVALASFFCTSTWPRYPSFLWDMT